MAIQLTCTSKKAKPGAAARRSSAENWSPPPDFDNPTRKLSEEDQAERSGQAERRGNGGSGVSPDYDTTQHARAQIKAKRSGQA